MRRDALALFRRFRHDLLNELQIVSGHLQLGRSNDVLRKDVQVVIERIREISEIFSCRNDQLSVLLWDWLEQARELDVSISFDLSQLQQPLSAARLDAAADLMQSLFAGISELAEEERCMHIRLDSSAPALILTVPAVILEWLSTGTAGIETAAQDGSDGDAELRLHLC